MRKLLPDEESRTGIVEAIVPNKELARFLGLLIHARIAANKDRKPRWIVRALGKLYVADTIPEKASDIDAIYIIGVMPDDSGDPMLVPLLNAIHRAIVKANSAG